MFVGLTYIMYSNHNLRHPFTKNMTSVCHTSYYEQDELERHWLIYLCSNM